MTEVFFDARNVDPRVRHTMRVLEFAQSNVPNVKSLAKSVGLSTFHFARLFADHVGETCMAYSRRIRLDGANNQLIHDEASLSDVAETFGYENQAAFTRAYARQFGAPPTHYIPEMLGRTDFEHAIAHLSPVATPTQEPLLLGRVKMVARSPRAALARRFYGYDIPGHWRRFIDELPAKLSQGAAYAGMSYDNARVTPDRHWRYDCALVFGAVDDPMPQVDPSAGLDSVEIPGGLHAEIEREGSIAELWYAAVGLLTEWLPDHREYRPEGDPIVHWLPRPPLETQFAFTATIRVRPFAAEASYNLKPLTLSQHKTA